MTRPFEKNGNTIRVSARISDAQTGIMRWADVFDRDISNLLAVEDEIAEIREPCSACWDWLTL